MKKNNLQKQFKKITTRIKNLEQIIANAGKKIKALEKQGCEYNASPLWKIQKTNKTGGTTKYLRLSYGYHRYKYIGNDPAKIKSALAAVDRARTAENLKDLQRREQRELNALLAGVTDLIREHC